MKTNYNFYEIRAFTKEWKNITSELRKSKYVDLSKIKLVPEGGENNQYSLKTENLLAKINEVFGINTNGTIRLASMTGMSANSMRQKLKRYTQFTTKQKNDICKILNITEAERSDYFD